MTHGICSQQKMSEDIEEEELDEAWDLNAI
jgi:hypothetical protein